MTERSHPLWAAQVLQGASFADWFDLYRSLEQRRDFLNYQLPCRSLEHQPPLVAHPDAMHSGRWYELAYASELLALDRIYAYLAQGRWFRLVAANGTLRLGGRVYDAGLAWHRHQPAITFDADSLCLRFANEAGETVHQAPIRGISRTARMGDWQTFVNLPALQLVLPFSWHDQRLTRLYEIAS
jgi:hypothetical protein